MLFESRIVRLPELIEQTGLSRTTIYLRMKEGKFPERVSLGGRSIGWLESDLKKWFESQIEKSKQGGSN